MTIAEYTITRVQQLNVDTLFGVVGYPCADVFAAAEKLNLRIVHTSSDLEAGYAADGYARLRGLSIVSVSYGPGTLSLINALAAGYVEKSPVLVVSGGPSAANLNNETTLDVLFSHSTGRDATDFHVAEQVVALAMRVRQASDAPKEIDTAIVGALTTRRPVYLEVPKDLWSSQCAAPGPPLKPTSSPSGQEEDIARTILRRISQAKHPVLLLGEEIQRYGLMDSTEQLLAKLNLPWLTTTLGKGVISEQTPGFVGVYSGPNARPGVASSVNNSDFILALGCVFSTGCLHLVDTHRDKMAHAYNGLVRIDQGNRVQADLGTLLDKLRKLSRGGEEGRADSTDRAATAARSTRPSEGGLTYDELFEAIKGFLDDAWLFIADTSLSITPAAELTVRGRDAFMADSTWASVGHSVAAAVGASFATQRRPLVLCGDGGFQMTATALSTMATHNQRCVVIVIDNGLYGYEQYLLDPGYYNDPAQPPLPYAVVKRWDYPMLAKALGLKYSESVDTPRALTEVLAAARNWDGPGLISAIVTAKSLPHELPH